MCPGCVAYLAGKVLILMVALGLANLTDIKFGLWVLLGIIAQTWVDCAAIYSGEPPPIHPGLIFMQMVVLGYRGAKLLEGRHWTKLVAEKLGAKIALFFRGAPAASFPRSQGLMQRLARRGWEFGKTPVRHALLWALGPLLAMLADLRSAIGLLLISAFLFGVHFQSFEIESIGWGLSYVEMWIPLSVLGLALTRGVFVFYRRKQHWLRSWILGEKKGVCNCPPDCPGCECCAPWLMTPSTALIQSSPTRTGKIRADERAHSPVA